MDIDATKIRVHDVFSLLNFNLICIHFMAFDKPSITIKLH